ncbi:MAG: MBL fold metallo-hydrolase [Candidatus Nanopelagicales bacterium]
MRLTVVGSSGSFPGPDSPASCYLVEHDGARIVLDMGNGALGQLQRHTDIYDIHGLVLSHLHVDHFIDLCSYYVALKYRPEGAAPLIPVWGPADTHERLITAYGLSAGSHMGGELDVRALSSEFTIGPFRITTRRMRHPVEAYAIRVEAGGRSITYSGDTGPTTDLADLARDTDLALFEASFVTDPANPPDLHLTGAEAAQLARQAGAGQVLLTHLVPWHDPERVRSEAAAVRDDVQIAAPGLTIDLS